MSDKKTETSAVDPKSVTFLVVDDDSMVRDILVQYLKSFGYVKILEAKDGKLALKIIQNHLQPIDVIISDWEMPHLDGLTLLRAVRKDMNRHNVKFLMVSSQSSHERMKISKAAKSHVDAYIVKPFRADVLREKIHTLINGGIDESSAEFEAAIQGGRVLIAEGDDTDAIGAVDVVGDTHNDLGLGDILGEKDGHRELPPQTYDLTQMNITVILNLAKSYLKVKWYDKAVKLCTEATQQFPGSADLSFYLGYSYFLSAKHDEAVKYLKQATTLKPYHVEALSILSEIERLKKAS